MPQNAGLDAGAVGQLDHDILTFIESADCDNPDEPTFDELALRVFAFQFSSCDPYRRFCERRGVTGPVDVTSWREIPALPSQAYKDGVVACFPEDEAVGRYRTSGTSSSTPGTVLRDAGTERLIAAAQLRAHRHWLLPDVERITMLLAVPTPAMRPRATIAACMARFVEHHGTGRSRYVIDETGMDFKGLAAVLHAAEASGDPVAVYATSYTFVHFFDWCAERGEGFTLPPGSRINHGSGYKGRSRAVAPEEFHETSARTLGIEPSHDVNVLGITETGARFFDNVLRHPGEPRHKPQQPWARVRIVDPLTLEDQPPGTPGQMVHVDLTLRGNVLALQTDDLGVARGGGFEILGRLDGAEARGCNLTMEEYLAARGPA